MKNIQVVNAESHAIASVRLKGPLRRSNWLHRLAGMAGIVTLIAIWELANRLELANNAILPGPWAVLRLLGAMIEDGSLFHNAFASLKRIVAGFSAGFLAALAVGLLMGTSEGIRRFIGPVVELFRPIPPFAMIPLGILWFGIGEVSKDVIIAYATFFPVVLNVSAGMKQVDPVHLKVAQSLGASRWQAFRHVVLRSALPLILTGMKAGVGMAFISLVAAELIASSDGLGFLIQEGRSLFNTEQVIAGMIAIGIAGALINRLIGALENYLIRWK
jgi:ABC-type nitrate/sulfonate/bicarbonate transport system permease component